MMVLAAVLVASILATGSGAGKIVPADADEGTPLIHMLRPKVSSSSGGHLSRWCESWRFAVETNSARNWSQVPKQCEHYVGNYMMGGHYRRDSRAVIDAAVAYAERLKLTGTGKEVWVFDVDETTISNLPYYAKHGFGAEEFNWTAFNDYAQAANAPPLPETLRLYKRLQSLGVKSVILTGRREDKREATAKNLERAGYHGYEKLLVKPQDLRGVSSLEFKAGERKKLEDAGYIIVGNIGDQWTDILGAPEGARTFKLPDPMYYVN
ncbi:hypothetical protein EJB05_33101, partial [Eragrostis curvula]